MFDFDDTRRRSRLSRLLQQKLPLWLTLVIVLLVTVFFGVQHASHQAAEQRYKAFTGELQAQRTSLQAHDADAQRRHLIVPVQGLTRRLGTVVVRYAAP
jgi:high-affinity K+ transport system ATPase subunit B